MGAFLFAHDDGRAGEADLGGIGDAGHQVGVEVVAVAAVRFVHQHQDGVVAVQDQRGPGDVAWRGGFRRFPRGSGLRFSRQVARAVLLDHGEHQSRSLAAHQRFQLVGAGRHLHRLAGQVGGGGKLRLQVLAVGDHDDFEAPQIRLGAQLPDQKHHRQAFARALGMPDDAAPAVVFAVLDAGFAGA